MQNLMRALAARHALPEPQLCGRTLFAHGLGSMQATLGGSLAVARAPARAVGSAAARATPFVAAARSVAPRSRQQLRAAATAGAGNAQFFQPGARCASRLATLAELCSTGRMILWRRMRPAWLAGSVPPPPAGLLTVTALPAPAAPEAPAAASRPEPSYGSAADTYAVVEIGGHQLVVEEGRWYTVNRLEVRGVRAPGLWLAAFAGRSLSVTPFFFPA